MTKKIILFIVEGITDETSLGLILSRLYKGTGIRFHVAGTDITSQNTTNTSNILVRLSDEIKSFQKGTYRDSDILQVVHLIDTDGAFVSDEHVVYEDTSNPIYTLNSIKTSHVEQMKYRNQRKSSIINKLVGITKVRKVIPYTLFYFSCNLEHVLHDIQNLPWEDKIEYAEKFQDRFDGKETEFVEFLKSESFTVKGDFKETWDFIKRDCNSLNRYCNFHLYFKE